MRLDAVLDRPAYNFMIHTSPIGEEINDHYHWHIEIIPKLTKVAGFEWGTGFYINPTPPEESARFLREAQDRLAPAPRRKSSAIVVQLNAVSRPTVDSNFCYTSKFGAVPKWPKGEVCKTSIRGFESHPRLQIFLVQTRRHGLQNYRRHR